MRHAIILVFLAPLALAGCFPEAHQPMPSTLYGPGATLAPLVLAYGPRATAPSPDQVPQLQSWSAAVPPGTTPVLLAAGPRAAARARALEGLLGRPIALERSAGEPPDQALLTVPPTSAIVSQACQAPGVPVPEGFWPGADARRDVLPPPGCSIASILAAQVTRPADLLAGRPLPPGAALPVAQAIERYDHRNERMVAPDTGTPAAPGDSSTVSVPAGNPLLGAVPPAGAGH